MEQFDSSVEESSKVSEQASSNRETTSSSVQVVRRNWQKLLYGWSCHRSKRDWLYGLIKSAR